ncbi:MAG: glycosyltransferase family A protein [Verrucomicrobiales bacterium]
MFDLLDHYDLACAHAENRPGCELESVPTCFPEMNTGVILFRKSAEVGALFSRWHENYAKALADSNYWFRADQPPFREARISARRCRIATLTAEYNCRFPYPVYLSGEVKILHGHGGDFAALVERLNASPDMRIAFGGGRYLIRNSDKHPFPSLVRERLKSALPWGKSHESRGSLVTVAIPCFNAERWIRECVGSALGQSHRPVEVLVLDDGSSDRSLEVLGSFGDSVRVLAEPNRGSNPSRNRLLAEARGEWIQFLDADDYLLPDKIARQLAEGGGGRDADLIYSPGLVEERDGQEALGETAVPCDHDPVEQWLRWRLVQTGAALWRTEALRRIGGWNEDFPCCQDNEIFSRAIRSGLRLCFAPTSRSVYRSWPGGSISRKNLRRVLETRDRLIDEMLAWLKVSGKMTDAYRRAAGITCFESARTLAADDLAAAAAFHDRRRRDGLIHLEGGAAPPSYRLAYRIFGFPKAERLAQLMRRK